MKLILLKNNIIYIYMIKTIYISIIVLVTIWTLYLYLENDQKYKNEMNRITYLEHKIRKKNDYIKHNRMSTIPCSVVNLETPVIVILGQIIHVNGVKQLIDVIKLFKN